jgi:EVE domain
MAFKVPSRKFSTRTHKGRACFSIPAWIQNDLSLRKFGNRVKLIIDSPTGHFEGTKQMISGSEIYGKDLNESGIKKNQSITVVALRPDHGEQRNYWALMSIPGRYDIQAAVAELDKDDWTVKRSNVRAGDRVAIWKARGRNGHRGIVALGQVVTDPAPRKPLPASRKYFLDLLSTTVDRRVIVRYVVPPKAPLWLEEDKTGLLAKLSVARATGGTVFKIAPEHWQKLVALLGGWRTGARSPEAAVVATVAARVKGKGSQTDSAPILKRVNAKVRQRELHESPLRNYDEDERRAVLESKDVIYRRLHNRMTRALDRIFRRLRPTTETSPAGRCDAIVRDYDGMSRDLLIEAKPYSDKGSIRIAIGQLFDYGRYRTRQAATDPVVLTITRPPTNYIDLLIEHGITAVWFGNENCKQIAGGKGKAWLAIAGCIGLT